MKKLAVLGLSALLAACGGGGGSSAPASTAVSVSPSLGKFSPGAHVVIKSPDGKSLGTGLTDATGTASISIGTYSGPILVEVTGDTTVKYYDEGTNTYVGFGASDSLRALAPAVRTAIGVTPFTHAAVEAIKAANGGSVPATVSTDTIALANSRLQAAFGLTDVLQAPTLVDGNTGNKLDVGSAGDQYALKLAALATLSTSTTSTTPALDVAKTLAADMTDSILDGKQTDPANPTGPALAITGAAFDGTTVAANWSSNITTAATNFGTTDTQTLVTSNPTVLGTVTADVSTVTTPPAGTSTTDVQLAKDMFGELRTTLYAYLNNGKTGFLDNQATRANADLAANVVPNLNLLQGRIRTLDMGVSTFYAAQNNDMNYLTLVNNPSGNQVYGRIEGSPYNVINGISGFRKCWTDVAPAVVTTTANVYCVAAAVGTSFYDAALATTFQPMLRTVTTYNGSSGSYSYSAMVIRRAYDPTTFKFASTADPSYPDPTVQQGGTVNVTPSGPAPAGTIVISGTMPPSTPLTGPENLSVNLTSAYTATNLIRATVTGSVSAPNLADTTKSVSLSIDPGTYFDVDTTNMATTGGAPVAVNFVGTAQTAETKFTGTLAMDTFLADADGVNAMFTHATFNGSISDLTTGGAGQFLTGQLALNNTNYAQFHSTQPLSATNYPQGTMSFTGTVQAPSRPAMTLNVSGGNTAFQTNSVTLDYSYGTIKVTGTATGAPTATGGYLWTLNLTNQNAIQVASDTSATALPGDLLVTKAGSSLAKVSNNVISYVDGVTESLN